MKILFLLMLSVLTLAAFAQVTVEINSVTPGERDGYKGDYINYTISAPNATVYGVSFHVDFGKSGKGGAGGYGYPVSDQLFSHKTVTDVWFAGLLNGYAKRERTWTVRVNYVTDTGEEGLAISEPYTLK